MIVFEMERIHGSRLGQVVFGTPHGGTFSPRTWVGDVKEILSGFDEGQVQWFMFWLM